MLIEDCERITVTEPSAPRLPRQRHGQNPARQAKRSPYSADHDNAAERSIYLNAFSLLVSSCPTDRDAAPPITR